MNKIAVLFFMSLVFTLIIEITVAEESEDSFLPTWKLLNNEQKQQFIAGYRQGWQDAATVTAIAKKYIEDNPQKALSSLESIEKLYDLSGMSAAQLVLQIDKFYKDPDNHGATLSRAISAARAAGKEL